MIFATFWQSFAAGDVEEQGIGLSGLEQRISAVGLAGVPGGDVLRLHEEIAELV